MSWLRGLPTLEPRWSWERYGCECEELGTLSFLGRSRSRSRSFSLSLCFTLSSVSRRADSNDSFRPSRTTSVELRFSLTSDFSLLKSECNQIRRCDTDQNRFSAAKSTNFSFLYLTGDDFWVSFGRFSDFSSTFFFFAGVGDVSEWASWLKKLHLKHKGLKKFLVCISLTYPFFFFFPLASFFVISEQLLRFRVREFGDEIPQITAT